MTSPQMEEGSKRRNFFSMFNYEDSSPELKKEKELKKEQIKKEKEDYKKEKEELKKERKTGWIQPIIPSVVSSGRGKSWHTVIIDQEEKEVNYDQVPKDSISLKDSLFEIQVYNGLIANSKLQNLLERSPYRLMFIPGNYKLAEAYHLNDLIPNWNYLHEDLPKITPPDLTKKNFTKWVVEHIKSLEQEKSKKILTKKESEKKMNLNSSPDLTSSKFSSGNSEDESVKLEGNVNLLENYLGNQCEQKEENLEDQQRNSPKNKQQQQEDFQNEKLEKKFFRGNFQFADEFSPVGEQQQNSPKASKWNIRNFNDLQKFIKHCYSIEANHDERTIKHSLTWCTLMTFYFILIRYSSFDLFIVLALFANLGLIYALYERIPIIKSVAKKKLHTKITLGKKRIGDKFGFLSGEEEDE